MILFSDQPSCKDSKLTGGKGSSLAILNQIGSGVKVPKFFVVTTTAFSETVKENKVQELSKKTLKNMKISSSLEVEIRSAYAKLSGPVACRSSATTEDSKEASFAGQHSTYLNQTCFEDVHRSILKCWASLYNERAVDYRSQLEDQSVLMAVVVQEMVRPVVAGTGFSLDLSGYPGFHIAATYGLGEGLVSGEITSDEWLFHRSSFELIKRTCGSKKAEYVYNPQTSGIQLVPVAPERSCKFCLDSNQALEVAKLTSVVWKFYLDTFGYQHIDTEWALSENQQVFFLQARPVVNMAFREIQTVDPKLVCEDDVILQGRYSLIGACHGIVKIIDRFEDLVNKIICIEPDDIVVAVKTGNYFNQFLKNLKGIVTNEGSPTAHPMLIGRERHLISVIGCPDAVEILRPFNGKWVTLDGLKKKVYKGKQPLKTAGLELLQSLFDLPSLPVLPPTEESLKFLKSFGRTIEKEGFVWVANPDYRLSPAWASWTLQSLSLRGEALKYASGIEDKLLDNTGLIHENRVFDRFQPLRTTLQAFSGWGLEQCSRFLEHREMAMKEFKTVTENKQWSQYPRSFQMLIAHKWLSWFFRTYLEIQVTEQARQCGCSAFHLEQFQGLIQAQTDQLDMDHTLSHSIRNISYQVSDTTFEKNSPSIQQQVLQIAQQYRLNKDSDISADPPVSEVWQKVLQKHVENKTQGQLIKSEIFSNENIEEEFFPALPAFRHWIRLLIIARIQHQNAHHVLVAGNSCLREFLLKVDPTPFRKSAQELENLFQK